MTEASVCYNSTLMTTVSNICWKKATVTLVSKNGLHSELPLSQGCLPSVLWHCWLGSRKGIRHVKNWAMGCWRGYLSAARCIWPSGFHCHSLSCASVKSRLVLPFWYWLTRVVPDKGPLNGYVCVCYLYLRVLFFATSIKTILECWDEFCLTIKIRLSTLQLLQPESKNSTAECRSLTA